MLLASPIPNQHARYPQIPPMFPNMPPPAPGYFHPQFAHQPNRPMPLPFRAASCCDDCSCGSSGGCPDCATSGRGSLSGAYGLGALGAYSCAGCSDGTCCANVCEGLCQNGTCATCDCMNASGYTCFGDKIESTSPANSGWDASGSGSSSGGSGSGSNNNTSSGGGFTSFISSLATNILKPNMVPGMVAPPWYTTPVGMGALIIGGIALYMIVKK